MSDKIVLFDIDGTLALVDHRRHLLPDWKAFFEAMVNDTPNLPVVGSLHAFEKYGYPIGIVTGRSEQYRDITERWIDEHVCPLSYLHFLLMRGDNDHRSDVIIKEEMLSNIRGQGFEPLLVVDDRPSVVAMWRRNGVTCLQCDDGAWERKHEGYDGSVLNLMVGPAGAGKTPWARGILAHDSTILSSDEFRAHLCHGNFKDQSNNRQVFNALHATTRVMLEYGMPVTVDATNIKTADRRKFLDLAPEDCRITYYVIERGIESRTHTGGWRNDVIVKGKTLIQYHDEVFRNNMNAILSGDHDPRVKVKVVHV